MLVNDMYKKVSEELDIPLERVMEYDRKMWEWVRLSLFNPTADTIEIPLLGSFSITKVKLNRTIKSKIIVLRRLKKKGIKYPNSIKVQKDIEVQTDLLRKLWNMKQMCKF